MFTVKPIGNLTKTTSGNGGYFSYGNNKFSLNDNTIKDLAIKAFYDSSKYATNPDKKKIEKALNYFLYSFNITSNNEGGGFDSINTWDSAGISGGILQYAYPNVNLYKLLNDYMGNHTLAEKVRSQFGNYNIDKIPTNHYTDPVSMVARFNTTLLKEVQTALITPIGISSQLSFAIISFWDESYTYFLNKLESQIIPDPIVISNDGSVSTVNSNSIMYYHFLMAYCFDLKVNRGNLNFNLQVDTTKDESLRTEGAILNTFLGKGYFATERNNKWVKLLNDNFIKQ